MKSKLYKCRHPDCDIEQPILSKGLCNYHRFLERQEENSIPKYKKTIKSFNEKNKKKRIQERSCLSEFFDYHLIELNKKPFSEESSTLIKEPSIVNIAHILPKRKQGGFPSIQCHLDNYIYLTWEEHNRFDKLLDEGNLEQIEKEFPNCWQIIWKRLKKLLPLCLERNKLYFKLEEYVKDKTN